ncbi:MAG: hypothetical protein A2Y75_10530 [Candidatus Solincola sediminis]|uniref:Alpha/beta hydrolase n=1 Tax=Candidatus Solincola sediminis TaxID=1797199 RepID=A0A1F2WES5_9ACTN|nr:MAG: hypothetical protein A2Y75_10530 [Candidatus Solincola sediminis]
MRKSLISLIVIAVSLLLMAAGCYQPGGPVPEEPKPAASRDYTQEDVDRLVVMEEQVISSPLPAEWGATAECNEIHFLRFRLSDGSTLDPKDNTRPDPASTDAMLVMLPGLLEGANGFEYLARQLIYQAKVKDQKNMEVWAIERRNNRLEDLSALTYIEDAMSRGQMKMDEATDAFVSYYYEGKPLNGKTFAGWFANQELPFLADFGLKLDTEDVFKVIQTLVPDPAVRKNKVFVGGHSMGGMMTSNFAGWDLDGNPATTDDAGYNNCAGMFGLDTFLSSIGTMGDTLCSLMPDFMAEEARNQSEDAYSKIISGFKDGSLPVVLNSGPMFPAEATCLLELVALGAYYEPESEDSWIRKVPFSEEMKLLLRFLNSKDYDIFIQGSPDSTNFRYTNEAVLGLIFDDSLVPITAIQNSMGFLKGGPVVLKEFPTWPAGAMMGVIPPLENANIGKGPYYIANDAGPVGNLGTGPLYSWANFDEIGNAGDPDYKDTTGETAYTTMENEMTDIEDVARAIFKGPINLVEWYFSMRMIVDISAAMMSWAPKYGLNFLHGDKLIEMPQVLFIAEHGMMRDMDVSGLPGEKHYLKGYNHMDVETACANTSSRRPNEVIGPLLDFVEKNAR